MKGKILDYMINTSSGVISGDDGNRYRFNASEWMQNDSFPQQGASVDFVVDGENATKIYVIAPLFSQRKTSAAAIISLSFGALSWIFGWWVLMIPSFVAVVAGHIARSDIKNSNGMLEGDGLAIGGLILGYSSIFVGFSIFIGIVGFLGALSLS